MAECLRVVGGKGFGSTVRKEGTKKSLHRSRAFSASPTTESQKDPSDWPSRDGCQRGLQGSETETGLSLNLKKNSIVLI